MSRVALLSLCLALAACVQQPPHREQGNAALVKTWGSFVSVDGGPAPSGSELMLAPGLHTIEVSHRTYRFDYVCTFEFDALAGNSYEIIDQSNDQPLTLYRWRRQNALWSRRIDPLEPRSCKRRSSEDAIDNSQLGSAS